MTNKKEQSNKMNGDIDYKDLVEDINDVIFTVDTKGIITYISPRIKELAGYKSEEIIGQPFLKFVFQEDLSDLSKDFGKNIKGEIKPSEYRVKTKKGEMIWVYSRSRPIKKGRKIIGIRGVLMDITDRKATEEKLKKLKIRFEDIVKTSSDWIWEVNEKGEYTFVSEGVKDILGYDPGDLIGNSIFEFVSDEEGKRIREFFREALSEKKPIKDLEVWNITRTGKGVCLLTNWTPIKDNGEGVKGFRGVSKDVTHRKEIEKMKNELISLASHQLRTPLSGIKWGILALEEEGVEHLTEEQNYYLERINQFNERMIDLVELLVNVSRIESNSLVLRKELTNMGEMARDLIEKLMPEFGYKNQEINVEIEEGLPEIVIDKRLIRRALRNFLTNAIKYSPEKGKISLSVLKRGDNIICWVEDNGYGILEEENEQIFGKFFRGKNIIKKELEGLGLGLYFGKVVVGMSGGETGFKSETGKGSTFWFSLPIHE